MRLVQGHGINDFHRGWRIENEWNEIVYQKWQKMLQRCYDEEFHKTKNGERYKDCTVCERWLLLSNFVEDVPKIDGYDEEMFLNGELELDKDIKSGGTNKIYIIEQCTLTTHDKNMREAMRTRDNNYLQGESHPMKGKLGSEHPNSKQVAQYDKQTHELIKIWDSMHDVERELGIAYQNICACCKGKQKSAGGYIWKYVEEEF